jgi:hypothetical protein
MPDDLAHFTKGGEAPGATVLEEGVDICVRPKSKA